MTEEEKMRVIFNLTADRAVFIDVIGVATSTLSNRYGVTKKTPGKSFEKRSSSFGFPDFV
jgi:hypothetical protein